MMSDRYETIHGLVHSQPVLDPGFAELVEMFAAEMPGRAAALESALGRQEWDELRRCAHQLKGSASSYGFPQITQAAGSLEMAIQRREDPANIGSLAAKLAKLCRQVQAA